MKQSILSVALMALLAACGNTSNNTNSSTPTTANTPAEKKENNTQSNDELKAYMIAGIYTIQGFGGIDAVNEAWGNNPDGKDYLAKLASLLKKDKKA